MQPIVSVLIPVYNREKYISKALDSVINQTYSNLEIIIVDDFSNDKSKEILREYEKKDNRIKIIYKKQNKGVGEARNDLISNASGKYIVFCDSDDYIELNEVENLVKIMETKDVDLVIFRYRLIKKKISLKPKKIYMPNGKYFINDIAKYHLKNPKTLFWGSLCNKCYKSSIIKKNNIKFTQSLEDVIFNINYLKFCKSCYVLSDYFYNYNQTNISMTRTLKENNITKKQEKINCFNKWNDFSYAYYKLNECYNNVELRKVDKINLNRYLYSIYLELKRYCYKNDLKDVINQIKETDQYICSTNNLKKYKYIINFQNYIFLFIHSLKVIVNKFIN
ncbi:glycosyltransferase family 2 protein [Clostridium perfringens]